MNDKRADRSSDLTSLGLLLMMVVSLTLQLMIGVRDEE